MRFVVETALDLPELWRKVPPRRRAAQVFGHLGVWDTAQNNGVLIYVLLADRDVEILADRGIAARVSAARMGAGVPRHRGALSRRAAYGQGSVAGVRSVGALLARHFPNAGAAPTSCPISPCCCSVRRRRTLPPSAMS